MSRRTLLILLVGQALIDVALAAYCISQSIWQSKVTQILLQNGLF